MNLPTCPQCGGDLMLSPLGRVVCLKQCHPETQLTAEQRKILAAADMCIVPIEDQLRQFRVRVKRYLSH